MHLDASIVKLPVVDLVALYTVVDVLEYVQEEEELPPAAGIYFFDPTFSDLRFATS